MTTVEAEGVLVGYDGSRGSERALSWAAREARARAVRLTVCHAWGLGGTPPADEDLLALARRRSADILARGVRQAQDAMGTGAVAPLLADGPAAAALCENSGRAAMVVLGSHGAGGGVPGLLVGSVTAQVAAYAAGPVVVERGHWRPAGGYLPGPVAVGTDGSPVSLAALRFAAEEAALRAAPLLAVSALADSPGALGGDTRLQDDVDSLLCRLEKEHPQVTVLRRIAASTPLAALLAAAQEAQLLVVGRRGLGGVRGMRLGSTGQGALNHACCPVAIVGPQ
jgi:nucleotide-binding universal stress UspA family protein